MTRKGRAGSTPALGTKRSKGFSLFTQAQKTSLESHRVPSGCNSPDVRSFDAPNQELYSAAQALLPTDAHILSAAEQPSLFRFDRHVVHTLTFSGALSPAPGMPFFAGPERLAEYLRNVGYTHLVFTPAHLSSPSMVDLNWLRLAPIPLSTSPISSW